MAIELRGVEMADKPAEPVAVFQSGEKPGTADTLRWKSRAIPTQAGTGARWFSRCADDRILWKGM
jgi:hypothetical protein